MLSSDCKFPFFISLFSRVFCLDTILAKRVLRKISPACQDQNDKRVPHSGDTTETARLAAALYLSASPKTPSAAEQQQDQT
jgi:hypothetical protein